MTDLISRQAAIDAFAKAAREKFSLSGEFGHYLDGLGDADKAVRALPPAQPEIIRCKDCLKREICRTTNIWAVAPDDDWFCADAERRTDDR